MKLQTIIPMQKVHNPLDYDSKILLLGSCFSQHIGSQLDYFKFNVLQNPFGILFHPFAIENLLNRAISGKKYTSEEVFEREGVWSCFDAHSQCNALSQEQLLDNLNGGLEETVNYLEKATHVFITLGTAWVYRYQFNQKTVANCHKMPQKTFDKVLMTPEEIIKSLQDIISLIKTVSPMTQILFTLSPVRHLKDGFLENQRGKSHLLTAVHAVLDANKLSGCSYFPSYEIMMDELRDYRFYEKDMVHPNALAVAYIWEKFKTAWLSEDIYPVMNQVEVVQKGLAHRSFNPDSAAHHEFQKDLQAKIVYLQKHYPQMDFSK